MISLVKFSALTLILCFSQNVLSEKFHILPKPVKVSEHVYAWLGPHGGPSAENKGFRMNLAFVVGPSAVAVLETGFYPEMANEMVRRIREITPLPIKYVINTNSQPDRYFGNSVFVKLGAEIFAHKKEIARMEARSSDFSTFVERSIKFPGGSVALPALPTHIITDKKNLSLGGNVKLLISTYKAGHTPAPLIVSIPSDNVVYAGDILYSGRLPAVIPGGNLGQWIETFDHLRTFKDVLFVPGHGKPAKLEAFEHSTYQYLVNLHSHIKRKIEDGIEMQEALDTLNQKDFSYLENFDELASINASNAYLELERELF